MDIPSTIPFFREEDIKDISEGLEKILKSGRLILGPYLKQFEKEFGENCGVKHAIGVNSCTTALEIVLRYFGVKGNEVVIPTNTFIASSNAVIYAGGIPVLADINPDTLCLDPKDLLRKITPKTKGVILVHISGLISPEIWEIKEICERKNLFLIEDAAHAHGATINGKKSGSLVDAGCFSFYPTKVMTTCTGGMITTQNDDLANYAISLRHHGVGSSLHDVTNLGNDWLMNEVQALLGIYQLRALENNIERRNYIADKYLVGLNKIDGIKLFQIPQNTRCSYYKYPIFLAQDIDKSRLVEEMKNKYHIRLGSVYDPPCHLQPVYKKLFGYEEGMLPESERTLKKTVCLPIFVQMTDDQIDYVLQSLKKSILQCRNTDVV